VPQPFSWIVTSLEGRGSKIAIESGDEQISYQQLLDRTNRTGNALRQLGVRQEERVVLLLPDSPDFLSCFFGIIKIGAVAVPTNTFLRPDEYEYLSTTHAHAFSWCMKPCWRWFS